MKLKILIFAFIFIVSASLWAGGRVVDRPYKLLIPPQPVQTGDKIEVVEVFWYGCPHCFQFEPYLEKWLEQKPDDVEFVRLPGVLGKGWIPHARAFYAAEQLGVLDKIHRPLFNAIHIEGEHLANEDQLARFFENQNIDEDDFRDAFNSEGVDQEVKQAFMRGRDFRITGVPTVIVNGKYLTSASMAGSHENVIKIIDELITRERSNSPE